MNVSKGTKSDSTNVRSVGGGGTGPAERHTHRLKAFAGTGSMRCCRGAWPFSQQYKVAPLGRRYLKKADLVCYWELNKKKLSLKKKYVREDDSGSSMIRRIRLRVLKEKNGSARNFSSGTDSIILQCMMQLQTTMSVTCISLLNAGLWRDVERGVFDSTFERIRRMLYCSSSDDNAVLLRRSPCNSWCKRNHRSPSSSKTKKGESFSCSTKSGIVCTRPCQ